MTNLVVGRELDALVAEKVMGCKVERRCPPRYGIEYLSCGCGSFTKPHGCAEDRNNDVLAYYSTDIAAAWDVVEKCKYEVWIRSLHGSCEVRIVDRGHEITRADADTAPLAICLAALKAVGDKVP